MNRIFFTTIAFAAFTLAGCGPAPDSPAAANSYGQEQPAATRLRVFSHTESFEEREVIAAAVSLIREGSALGSEQAEGCWKTESSRPAVREACILAWATGREASPSLESALLSHASESRNLSIALLRRKNLVTRLDLSGLLSLLAALGKDTPWLRGLAIDDWLKPDTTLSLAELQALWNAFGVNLNELDPAGAYYAYRIARKLGVAKEEELLGAFCDPTGGSIAQVRCWRFLSAIVDPVTGLGLERTARSFLPQRREEGWILFERAFPERAPLLRPYR